MWWCDAENQQEAKWIALRQFGVGLRTEVAEFYDINFSTHQPADETALADCSQIKDSENLAPEN